MGNKAKMPSIGFALLAAMVLFSFIFIRWANEPLILDRAAYEEKLGHEFAREGQAGKAVRHFLAAARIEDEDGNTSRRYRCAGTMSTNTKDRIKYFQLALEYNPHNENALNSLKLLVGKISSLNGS